MSGATDDPRVEEAATAMWTKHRVDVRGRLYKGVQWGDRRMLHHQPLFRSLAAAALSCVRGSRKD